MASAASWYVTTCRWSFESVARRFEQRCCCARTKDVACTGNKNGIATNALATEVYSIRTVTPSSGLRSDRSNDCRFEPRRTVPLSSFDSP